MQIDSFSLVELSNSAISIIIAVLGFAIFCLELFEHRKAIKIGVRLFSFLVASLTIWAAMLARQESADQETRQLKVENENLALKLRVLEVSNQLESEKRRIEGLKKDLIHERGRIRSLVARVSVDFSGVWNQDTRPFRTDNVVPMQISDTIVLRLEPAPGHGLGVLEFRLLDLYSMWEMVPGRLGRFSANVALKPDPTIMGASPAALSNLRVLGVFIPMLGWAEKNRMPIVVERVSIRFEINNDLMINLEKNSKTVIPPPQPPFVFGEIGHIFARAFIPLAAQDMKPVKVKRF